MLNFFLFKPFFFKAAQSGFYIDFFIKKICEVFIRNFLIYTANFLGEKYFIEYLTKKIIEITIYTIINNFNYYKLNKNYFFYSLLSIIFYFFSFINLYYILFF